MERLRLLEIRADGMGTFESVGGTRRDRTVMPIEKRYFPQKEVINHRQRLLDAYKFCMEMRRLMSY